MLSTFKSALVWSLAGSALIAAHQTPGPVHQFRVSMNGTCGDGVSCTGSPFGGCCSASGMCGSTPDYCGKGCKMEFGFCQDTKGRPSPDGTCAGKTGYTCENSAYGSCCSRFHFCGSGSDYCTAEKCLPGFGDCKPGQNGRNSTSPAAPYPSSAPDYNYFTDKSTKPHASVTRLSCPQSNGTTHTSSCGVSRTVNDTPGPGNGFITKTRNGFATHFATKRADVANPTTIIQPTILTSSEDITASSLASAAASATACANPLPKRSSQNAVFKREVIKRDCVPCEGQGGSLPFCGADETTNHYEFTPKTCRTVYYNFDITNVTLAPDGQSRIVLAVNGQMPGPLLEANWGDDVVVTVNNLLQDNGTSIHFHGLRQLNNAEYDGVPAITQCPIAPGDSYIYKWKASNYGTSWYHSHYAIQAWEGVVGPMIIHGPTSKAWDVDAGTVFLQDWSHETVSSQYEMEQDAVNGGPRTMDNGLINGMNTWGVEGTTNQTGQRFELDTKFVPGQTYLLRIINGAIQGTMKFYIDSHELEVINMDFTNIVPYKTDVLNIQIGQRYMVLVKANQTPGNYWMRADSQNACAANHQADDIKGIIRYADAEDDTLAPTSIAYDYISECVDEPLELLVPVAQVNAYSEEKSFTQDITVAADHDNLFKWYLSGTTFHSKYEDPTLVRVVANNTAPTYSGDLVLDLPEMGEWIYIIVESAIPLNHPIHLHGHDFLILGTGQGKYTNQPLNLNNPPRRDTANMPAAGWLVIAFETDNPGTWLMHCHIGWHTSMGFALQILEGQSMIKDTIKDECGMYNTCAKWNEFVRSREFEQHDSGV